MKLLTIAIPTIETRRHKFAALLSAIEVQIEACKAEELVEVIFEIDNKEISIGAKRQKLINRASGKYLVQIDDDDTIARYFVAEVLKATESDADCIGYYEQIHHNRKLSIITNRAKEWSDKMAFGADFVRTPFFKNPIKTEICKMVGCADLRFGEDEDFAKRVKPHIKTEHFIDKIMYHYRYSYEPHNQKYGIK